MSRVENRNGCVFLILPDNTALEFETCRTQSQSNSGGASTGRRSMIEALKSFAPRIARVTVKTGVQPSGKAALLVSPPSLNQH